MVYKGSGRMNIQKFRKQTEEKIILLEQDIYNLESLIEAKRTDINDCIKILAKIDRIRK